jgi:hypothetical protein
LKASALPELWSCFTAIYRIIQLVRESDWKSVSLPTEKIHKHGFRHPNFASAIHTIDRDHNIIRSLCSDLLRKPNNNGSRKQGIDLLDRIFERVQQHPKVLLMTENHDNYFTTMAAYGNCFEGH